VGGIDYEVEYNNRARVPENPALMAGWATDAAAYRAEHAPRKIAYGPGVRNTIDLFAGDGKGPMVVFVHGGYWQSLDGSSFGHCARGLNAHGIDVAVPSYDLCPQVTVDAIISEMRAAARELAKLGRPLVISGHSAGGHLAACLLATDWPALDVSLPNDLVIAAYAISGLFNLVPLVGTSINRALGLDDNSARAASPSNHLARLEPFRVDRGRRSVASRTSAPRPNASGAISKVSVTATLWRGVTPSASPVTE